MHTWMKCHIECLHQVWMYLQGINTVAKEMQMVGFHGDFRVLYVTPG